VFKLGASGCQDLLKARATLSGGVLRLQRSSGWELGGVPSRAGSLGDAAHPKDAMRKIHGQTKQREVTSACFEAVTSRVNLHPVLCRASRSRHVAVYVRDR